MKKQPLLILAALAIVLVLLGMFSAQKQQPTGTLADVRQPVFPDLKQTLADVQGVTIREAGNKVLLEARQQDGGWVAANKGGYPVQTTKLRELLEALAEAEFQEAKTSNSEQYHHLGLRDTGDAGSEALRITVERAERDALDILIGKQAAGWNTSYARLLSDPRSWVLDREIRVEKKAVDWIEPEVIDIDLERVQRVEHVAPDGERLLISKESPDQPLFDVAELPEGHVLTYEAVPEVIADVIDNLRLEDVVPADGFQWDDANTYRGTFRTFDGLVISSRALKRDEEHFVSLDVTYDAASRWRDPAKATAPEAADSAASESADEGAETSDEPEEQVAEESEADAVNVDAEAVGDEDDGASAASSVLPSEETVQAEAAALQRKLRGWVFRIPEYRYKGFIKRIGEIVKPEETASEGDPAGGEAPAQSPG